MWRQAGSDLKALAEQFAHSRERELVRRRAEQVDVASLDMQQFMELLKELFQVRSKGNGYFEHEFIVLCDLGVGRWEGPHQLPGPNCSEPLLQVRL